MKIAALILFLFISSGSVAQGSMQPHSGSDSYGQGLSYPDNSGMFSIASFLAMNNTNGTSPVYLGTNVFRPNESLIKSLNRTDYYGTSSTFICPSRAFMNGFPKIARTPFQRPGRSTETTGKRVPKTWRLQQ